MLHSGVVRKNQVILNPGRRRLQGGEVGIIIGTSQKAVDLAMGQQFTVAPPLTDPEKKSSSPEADSPRSLVSGIEVRLCLHYSHTYLAHQLIAMLEIFGLNEGFVI